MMSFFRDRSEAALWLLVAILICFDVFVLLYGINNGIDDSQFPSRQAQTALTAYWLIKEPHTFAYITPVLGAPWSMPFEYPVYQWLVVFLSKSGVPLVIAGRLISFAAFLACLLPLKSLARDLNVSRHAFLIVATICLACPLYIYWSRAFMIETAALLFSLCWLAGFIRSRANPSGLLWAATLGFGCLAALTKFTTFVSIGPIVGAIYLFDLFVFVRRTRSLAALYGLFWRGLLCLIPILVGFAWVAASDHFKEPNVYSLYLNSKIQQFWVFGTLAQRFSLRDTIFISLKLAFGYAGIFVPLLIAIDLINNRYRTAVLFSVGGYLAAFFIFTNLHTVHTYYQAANAIFICIAVGLTIGGMLDKGWRKTAYLILAVVIVSQLQFFREYFWHDIANDNIGDPHVMVAKAARDATKPGESLLVFGDDWSSTIPFYSERKSLVVPDFTQQPTFEKMLANPQEFLGEAKLGAIIDCRLPPQWQTYRPEQMAEIDRMLAGRKIIFQNEHCRLVSP